MKRILKPVFIIAIVAVAMIGGGIGFFFFSIEMAEFMR